MLLGIRLGGTKSPLWNSTTGGIMVCVATAAAAASAAAAAVASGG